MRLAFFTAVLAVPMLLSGCATEPSYREYIDNDTAATVTAGNAGWIFARERPDLAIHAQDYVTVTPVQVNRSGKRVAYLFCDIWSTIDRRGDKAIVPAKAELALVADDRRIPLPASSIDIRTLGFGHAPSDPPNRLSETRIVAVDVDLLRYIAAADQVRISISTDGVAEYFLSWRDGRRTFAEMVHHLETGQ